MKILKIKKTAILTLAVSTIFLTGCGSAPVKQELTDHSAAHYEKIFAQQQSYVYDSSKSSAWNYMQERGLRLGNFDLSKERYQETFDIQDDEFGRAIGNAFSVGNIAKNVGLFVIGTQFSTDIWKSKSTAKWAKTLMADDPKKVFVADKSEFKTKKDFAQYVARTLFTNNLGNMSIESYTKKRLYPRVRLINNRWVFYTNTIIKDAEYLNKLIKDYKDFPKVEVSYFLLPHESTPFVKAPHVLTSKGERLLFIKPEAK